MYYLDTCKKKKKINRRKNTEIIYLFQAQISFVMIWGEAVV